jgi:hypothetical protein
MSNPDDLLRSPKPASSALLHAALGGLLCFSAACTPGTSNPPADTGTDATPQSEASATEASAPEASAPEDARTVIDVATPVDASAEASADASVSLDASVAMDASTNSEAGDASLRLDAVLVDARDVTCDVVPDRVITSTDAARGLTIETFRAMCDRRGGYIEIHPHCGGANTCRGFSYDEGTGDFTEHTCAGLNTCNGWSCVIPD